MEGLNLGGVFPNVEYGVVIAFIIIGAGLKFIDETFDKEIFNKKIALLFGLILVAIAGSLTFLDPPATTILFSILFAVLIAGKVDNTAFKVSALSFILIFGFNGMQNILWIPLAILTVLGLIDEEGNDYVDRLRRNKALEFFFLHRFSMKLGVFVLCALSFFPWLYFLAFLAFDIAYDLIGMVGNWMATISETDTVGIELKTSAFICKSLPPGVSQLCFIKEKDDLG